MSQGARILVIDGDERIRRALRVALRANSYEVIEAADGEAGLDLAAAERPDLIVLDLALPDLDGVDVCRRLREWSRVPVIVLSAAGDDDAKVRALDADADDYVTKPFSVPELLARMRVALRRAARAADGGGSTVRAGEVEIDLARRVVTRAGQEVHLTPTEFGLLRSLARRGGRVVTHDLLVRDVLGQDPGDGSGSLRLHVSCLRKKLEDDPRQPRYLVTEPGVGYRLLVED
jgi:two-component system KDP operon response regulator KdpE